MISDRQRVRAPALAAVLFLAALVAGIGAGAVPATALAAAAGMRVYVLDLTDNGVGKDAAKLVTETLRNELAPTLGERLVRPAAVAAILARPEVTEQVRCARETYVECGVAVGQKLGVGLVVSGTVAALGDAQMVDLRLIDVRASTEINRLQSPLSASPEQDRQTLRELGVRLVAPEHYVGTLEISNLQPGDKVLVDGADMAAQAPQAQMSLPVGSHVLEITRGSGVAVSKVIDVKYGEKAKLTLAGSGQTESTGGSSSAGSGTKSKFPIWPGLAAGGATVVAALVAVGFTLDYLFVSGPNLRELEANPKRDHPNNPCPAGDDRPATWQCYVEIAKGPVNGDFTGIGIGSAIGVVGAVATGVLLYLALGDKESGEASPGALPGSP